jgi:hypothetical protein
MRGRGVICDKYKSSLFRWVQNYCSKSKFILKTDDDQVVDVHHLVPFLDNFLPKTDLPFFLCHYLQDQKPQRDFTSKWFVSINEFPGQTYPEYCAGWAYVTNHKTIDNILGMYVLVHFAIICLKLVFRRISMRVH